MEASQTPPQAPPPPADVPPQAPQAPAPEQSTEQLLSELVQHQQAQRTEIAALREELSRSRAPAPPPPTSQVRSQEELLANRMSQVEQHSYYCPACGLLYDYQRECTGKPEAGHPPVDVISTDELKSGDAQQHTAAPVAAA